MEYNIPTFYSLRNTTNRFNKFPFYFQTQQIQTHSSLYFSSTNKHIALFRSHSNAISMKSSQKEVIPPSGKYVQCFPASVLCGYRTLSICSAKLKDPREYQNLSSFLPLHLKQCLKYIHFSIERC